MPSHPAAVATPQITLVQIDNYGPWTVTPEPRRETDLQTLQSRLFADLSQLVGTRDGYVFFTRFDNMIAVTNGIDMDTHGMIQESVRNRYPVTVSLSVAADDTPTAALAAATERLQDAGSAQDEGRQEILRGEAVTGGRRDDVEIAHFDVNDATGKYTDRRDAFESFIHIEEGYYTLMRHLYERYDSLAFFVGGDNVIAATPGLDAGEYRAAIDHVEETAGIDLKVGVGEGPTAKAAGMAAKHALEDCRRDDTRVETATTSTGR